MARRTGTVAFLTLIAWGICVAAAHAAPFDRVDACRSLIGAFEDRPSTIVDVVTSADPSGDLVVLYETETTEDGPKRRWIACRGDGRAFGDGWFPFSGVETDRQGPLNEMALFMLHRWWWLVVNDEQEIAIRQPEGVPTTPLPAAAYALQQAANAIGPACVYVLLAIGYTLIYALIRRINLAFGGLYMIGAYVVATLLALTVPVPLAPIGAAIFVALFGWTSDRIVFRPLRGIRTQAPLIAALGLLVVLQEGMRLSQGDREIWLPRLIPGNVTVLQGLGGVTISLSQIAILVVTTGLCVGLLALLRASAFGRVHRACSDDLGMAALLGVDTDRAAGAIFALGSGFAAAAGCVVAFHYGLVSAYMGYLIGFKALAAAIVGGIGSVPGAIFGGVLIGVIETAWSAWFEAETRDIVVFGLLIGVLTFRPQGILGVSQGRGD